MNFKFYNLTRLIFGTGTLSLFEQECNFPQWWKFESKDFNGSVWLNRLTPLDLALPIGNVTFELVCRNHWHKHAGGQILLVTGGRGYYQEWGRFARKLLGVMSSKLQQMSSVCTVQHSFNPG